MLQPLDQSHNDGNSETDFPRMHSNSKLADTGKVLPGNIRFGDDGEIIEIDLLPNWGAKMGKGADIDGERFFEALNRARANGQTPNLDEILETYEEERPVAGGKAVDKIKKMEQIARRFGLEG